MKMLTEKMARGFTKFLGAMAVVGLLAMPSALITAGEAAAARITANVDISSQTMVVKRGNKVLHRWKVSTGRSGYRTPTGSYSPKRMHKMWHSRKYNMSPMPHSIFFRGGYAVHGTNYISRLGRPASHGCIRLHPTNAAKLYSLVKRYGPSNARIVIRH